METATPFVIGGDFNVEPHVLQQALADSPIQHVALQVVSPIQSTCRTTQANTTIDDWIVGGGAEFLAGPVATVETVAITPHVAVSLSLRSIEHYTIPQCLWKRFTRGTAQAAICPHLDIQ
jgi:hypothetical protein